MLKAAKEKVNNFQGKTDQVGNTSVHRNMAGLENSGRNIQYAEWEKYTANNYLSSKAVTHNRRIYNVSQKNTKGAHDH